MSCFGFREKGCCITCKHKHMIRLASQVLPTSITACVLAMYVVRYIYDALLLHPPSIPAPWYPPLACQVGSLLVWPCCFPPPPHWACLALSPPPVGWGLGSFGLAPLRQWRAVCSTEVYGCSRLLVSSLHARGHTGIFDVAFFSLQMVPLSLL